MQCSDMDGNDRRHRTILVHGEEPEATQSQDQLFYHCPFCLYKNNAHTSVFYHMNNHARVKHEEFTIFRCGLKCRETTHFHCCYCPATLIRRDQFKKHLSSHETHTTIRPELLPASTYPNAAFAGTELPAQKPAACGKSVEPPPQVPGGIPPTPAHPPAVKALQAVVQEMVPWVLLYYSYAPPIGYLTPPTSDPASFLVPPPGSLQRDCSVSHQNTRQGALPCGDQVACSSQGIRHEEACPQFSQLKLQLLTKEADIFWDCLVNGQDQKERETLVAQMPNFLQRCQSFFIQLESTASSTMPNTRMLYLTQQLCDKLEQLLLTYAKYNLLSLDESKPNNVSHFCIGRRWLGQLRLTTFRYCRPTPYLAQVNTGLYKRMRWNVDRRRNKQQAMDEKQDGESEERKPETVSNTEYYFLCCEDMPGAHAEADSDSQGDSRGSAARMWSIGQWVQEIPDPNTEDIDNWIMREVPQGKYDILLKLGSNEPSSSDATALLQQLLLSQQTTE